MILYANSGDPVQTPQNSDLGHCLHVLQTGHTVHFLAARPPRATQTLKQHMAGIEVSGLFDLKKHHAVFAFDVS